MEKIYLAAGCFWGVEEVFRTTPGILKTSVGYGQGEVENATYQQVCTGKTGHAEIVEVEFDPEKISFKNVIELFFEIHNPTTLNQQGADIGHQYRSGIYYLNADQKEQALKIIERLNADKFDHKIVTEVEEFKNYYLAEEYHQKYFFKRGGVGACHFNPNLNK